MNEYLTFTLCAPMAAFGGYAGHERRGSDSIPQRSAVLGLIGASLGIERTDEEGQAALRRYRIAVQSLTRNIPLRDYHTVQTVPRKIRRPISRRTAIETIGRGIETTITVRDYRTDVAIAAAIWAEEAAWSLAHLASALRTPEFVLYAGRKSCPLSAPLAPSIVQASDPTDAIRKIPAPDWLPRISEGPIACDPFHDGSPDRVEPGPVEPIDRGLWHFAQGDVWYFDRLTDS
ncbi:MAG: type I-E CRISPR-associated protein Cas5/CasD [Gammaproteobacteria bacterium]|nr:type I-E CRISPR-associated protein Cas5/CasD [Gammaproteobacteria bacterium]